MMTKIRQPSSGHVTVKLESSTDILQQLLHRALDTVPVDAALKKGINKMTPANFDRCVRAYVVTTKSGSFSFSERLHFAPLYDDAASCTLDHQALLDLLQAFRARSPDDSLKVVFFVSRVFAPGPPARVSYENLDEVIQELFVDKLRWCWQASAAAAEQSSALDALPSPAQREQMLKTMKEALRDSVLNDLLCSGEAGHEQTQRVLKSLVRNAGMPHAHGPLRSLVALKSDSFSHFAHCHENCEVVKVSVAVHFRPHQIFHRVFESAQLRADLFGDISHILQELGYPIIEEYIAHLKSSGFDVQLAFSNVNISLCTLKLVFPVRRQPSSASCIRDRVAQLIAATERFEHLKKSQDTFEIDDRQVSLAKGFRCPSCGLTSDAHSMFSYRREMKRQEFMRPYVHIFESASAALPEPDADQPVCRGLDRGPEEITWLQRISRQEQAKGARSKVVFTNTPLEQFEIGDVLLTSRVESYSDDLDANLKRYASPAQGRSKATVFMIERPRTSAHFIDPISVVRFLAPTFKESEYHIEKGAELRLKRIKRNTMGVLPHIQNCDTFVFTLVSNFNKLTPTGIANLKLDYIRFKRAQLLRDVFTPQDGFCNISEVMASIDRLGLAARSKAVVRDTLERLVREGELSFGCDAAPTQQDQAPSSPGPDGKSSDAEAATPVTVPRGSKVKLGLDQLPTPDVAADALPYDDFVPTLYPLLHLSGNSQQIIWIGSKYYVWAGGLLPRGSCPVPANCPAHSVVYSFKQLLRASYHDGSDMRCACPRQHGGSADGQDLQSLLENEAETIDNFMHELRSHQQEHGLTHRQLTACFECSASIPATYVDVAAAGDGVAAAGDGVAAADGVSAVDAAHVTMGESRGEAALNKKLFVRAAFLEQCRHVVGLDLPAVPCVECGETHIMFSSKGVPNMQWALYRSPIKNPNYVDSEYDPQCDSE
jgi:hypothetical protein